MKRIIRVAGFVAVFIFLHEISIVTSSENVLAKTALDSKGHSTELRKIQSPKFKTSVEKPNLILIPGTRGWLVSLYLPYLEMLKSDDKIPGILSIGSMKAHSKSELALLTENLPIESHITDSILKKAGFKSPERFTYPPLIKEPTQAAIALWTRYTVHSPDVVVSYINDFTDFLHASVFAAHFQLPLIPLDSAVDKNHIKKIFKQMQVNRVHLVSEELPDVLSSLPKDMIYQHSHNQISRMLIGKIGSKNIHNVILSSSGIQQFDNVSIADDALFFLPYVSLLRKAPLVFSPTKYGKSAGIILNEFITEFELTPRNITIFGDYSRVGAIEPDNRIKETIYDEEIELEPGTNYKKGFALNYGIGRLPYDTLDQVSLYYTRLMMHDDRYKRKTRDFVMISNLIASEGATLLFAEAVSKLTVKELKNFDLKGESFYAVDPKDPKIWRAALNSSMVIYEGHSDHFLALESDAMTNYLSVEPTYFSGYPLLILQSCNSLDDIDTLSNKGPVAIVGSSTRVHSASGSSFIKAYLDNILYENPLTLGEALRDAKNYFLSIVELKKLRGHEEQSKANRVALSFRVWGDPEIVLFPHPLTSPKKKPIRFNGITGKVVEMETPEKYYNSIKNDRYKLRSFPMSKQAGIVKSSKSRIKSTRRIESFYFFKVPYEAVNQHDLNKIRNQLQMGDVRNVLMEDDMKRWVYYLHYPKTEKKNHSIHINLNQ